MGTALIARGHRPEAIANLPLTQPSAVRAVHASYPEADAITACTFGLSFTQTNASRVAAAALDLARRAAGSRVVVASLGPGPRLVEASRALAAADVLLLETFRSLAALEEALALVSHRRIWATLSFAEGRTTDGWSPREAAERLAGRVEAVGANCGDGLAATTEAALAMVGAGVPVLGRPSAGVQTSARPEAFAAAARRMWSAGVTYVGGCCGIGPAHVRAAARTRRMRGER